MFLKISDSLFSKVAVSSRSYWNSLSPLNQLITKVATILFASCTFAYLIYKNLITKKSVEILKPQTVLITESKEPSETEMSKADTIFLELLDRHKGKLQTLLVDAVKDGQPPSSTIPEEMKKEIMKVIEDTIKKLDENDSEDPEIEKEKNVKPPVEEKEPIASKNEMPHPLEERHTQNIVRMKSSIKDIVKIRESIGLKHEDFDIILLEKIKQNTLSFAESFYLRSTLWFYVKFEIDGNFDAYATHLTDFEKDESDKFRLLLLEKNDKEIDSIESLKKQIRTLNNDTILWINGNGLNSFIIELKEKITSHKVLSSDEIDYIKKWQLFIASFDKVLLESIYPEMLDRFGYKEYFTNVEPIKEILALGYQAEILRAKKFDEIRKDLTEAGQLMSKVKLDTTSSSEHWNYQSKNKDHVLFLKKCNEVFLKYETGPFNLFKLDHLKAMFSKEGYDRVIKSIEILHDHPHVGADLPL
ncbi:MAG: hypothetical protein H0W88_06810 [Parachlamydiaceae bacterium]|nr:hypothetical protein [Parachlamydiaceae bacterium]